MAYNALNDKPLTENLGRNTLIGGAVGGAIGLGVGLLPAGGAAAGRLLLPAAGSAQGKLEQLGEKFGVSPVELANKAINAGTRMVDNLARNAGNINSVIPRPDGASGFVRVTLDPTGSRIISAGLQTANQVKNGLESGRFTPIQ